jgi:hypothetical protein
MTFHVEAQSSGRMRESNHDVWAYRLLLAMLYPMMLVPTVLSRALLLNRRRRGSIFSEARARVDRILPYVFMG